MSQLKVLFVGPYLQNDGWGRASKAFIHSLKDKCDLSVRNIFLGPQSTYENSDPFPELQKKEFSYDAIIQKVIPTFLSYNGRCGLNCAISCRETLNMNFDWKYKMRLMDKVFTFTDYERNSYLVDHLDFTKNKVHTVGEPVDVSKYKKEYKPINLGGEFKFYFIGENIQRKSLVALIKCYFQEFSYLDNVSLIIKTNDKKLPEEIQKVQHGLRKYFDTRMYPKIIHIDKYLSDEEMCSLHQSCDCFVMPSRGEAFCIPLVNAIGFENQVIINDNTSMADFVTPDTGWLVDSKYEDVFCTDPPIQDIYTCREKWARINEPHLMSLMRQVYNGARKNSGRQIIEDKFSYDAVGNNIIKCLQS